MNTSAPLFKANGRLKKSLVARIASGNICGFPKKNGQPCLGTPMGPNLYCWRHKQYNKAVGLSPEKATQSCGPTATLTSVVCELLKGAVPQEMLAQLDKLSEIPPDSLEDVVALARGALRATVQQRSECRITQEKYLERMLRIGDHLRKLRETTMKLAHQKIQTDKLTGAGYGDDAWDPTEGAGQRCST